MPAQTNDLISLSAVAAVAMLKAGEASPLEMIDAAAERIAKVDPDINALPTLCLERARACVTDYGRRGLRG